MTMISRRELIRIAGGGIAAISIPGMAVAAHRTKVIGIGYAGCTIANKLRESTSIPSHVSICTVGRSSKCLTPDFEIAMGLDTSGSRIDDRQIARTIGTAPVVLVIAGLGGRDGTGLTHHFVRVAKAEGAKAVSVLIMPFDFEGDRRSKAQQAVSEIADIADRVAIVDNQILFDRIDEDTFIATLHEQMDMLAVRSTLDILKETHPVPCMPTSW
jgi:cell division GTPase FtsZ